MKINAISQTNNINNNLNPNFKAQIHFIGDQSLLPKNGLKILKQKAEPIGKDCDWIYIELCRSCIKLGPKNSNTLKINHIFPSIEDTARDNNPISITGPMQSCKQPTFNAIEKYIEILAQKCEEYKARFK